VRDIFELSFRWQDGFIQVLIYALVIYLGLVIISKITDKREREGKKMSKYQITVVIDEPILSIDEIEADAHIENTLQWAGYNIVSIKKKEISNG
jgi:hypothetical protein